MSIFYVNADGPAAAGLPDVLQALAARTTSSLGARGARALPYLGDGATMAASMARVQEARRLRAGQLPLPAPSFPDIQTLIARLNIEAPLEGRELLQVAEVLDALAISRRFADSCRVLAPTVAQELAQLPDLATLLQTLREALAPDGSVRDEASVPLARAREQVRRLKERIRTQMEAYLTDETMAPYLQDSYVSVRHDRYVLPINASFASKVPGIIHNASQTGLTVFIEPTAITGLGNTLALAQSQEAEEVLRVLTLLSQELTVVCADISRGIVHLTALDILAASARLADDLGLNTPGLVPRDGALKLPGLSHPGLALSGQNAVANSVALAAPTQVLLISGANGGGKTVVLTAMALAVLMARVGLPIAAAPGAHLPLYEGLYCTVGDGQNLASGMSSFTAQLMALKDIAERIDLGWLVLIDELGGDTDPVAGAALAQAVLEHGAAKGAHLCVTTHLSALKTLPLTSPQYVNARMGYDGHEGRPTYHLEWGVAGQSRALDVARRLGFAAHILEAAHKHMGEEGAVGAAMLQLEATQTALDMERQQVAELRCTLMQQQAEQQERKTKSAERDAEKQSVHQQQLRDLYAQAQKTVAHQLKALRDANTLEAARRTSAALAQAQAALPTQTADASDGLPPVTSAAALAVGMWVHVRSLGKKAQVTHVGSDAVTVRMGNLRTRVPLSGLAQEPKSQAAPEAASRASSLSSGAQAAKGHKASPHTQRSFAPSRCDIRGLRLDEAERQVIRALDVCLSEGQQALLIVHGHGTGQLKEGLHDLLRSSPYVASFRLAGPHEGGQGVTVVQLDR